MLSKVYSAAVQGIDAYPVEVEISLGMGDPVMVVVGLPDAAVKESRDRVRTALSNSGFRQPRGRTTINLAPADVKKEGPSFDLPMALGIIAATEQADVKWLGDFLVVGELALSGKIRPVRGALPIALCARKEKRRGILVPSENAAEASVVDGLAVIPVRNLREAVEFLSGRLPIAPVKQDLEQLFAIASHYDVDFADVKGQEHVKRALEVAAAGGHNALMIGPPGAGKSMMAKRLATILPSLTLDEALETTKIHSIVGQLAAGQGLVATRPFRAPHHTVSDAGLLGGNINPTPGEISLAHHGVLFLDELPEFHRDVLEVLRQPLEEGRVTITRAAGSMTFPCEFMLVAAMNPCPCGYFGDPKRECRCSPNAIQRYRNKVSGPLLDRIDLHVEVPAIKIKEMMGDGVGEASEKVRARVETARERQRRRLAGNKRVTCNARMGAKELKAFCKLDESSQELLKMAITSLNLSARAYDRILKVARTIADLENADTIQAHHIQEAIQYRNLDRQLWV